MIKLKVNLSSQFSDVVNKVKKALSPAARVQLNRVASRAALGALRSYHRRFDARGGWRKGQTEGGSDFGNAIIRGWNVARVSSSSVQITNTAPYYRHKIRGGTIRAKRAKYLTIPLVPEAKGRFAEQFERFTGKRLFRPKGTNVLAVKQGSGIKPIYALRESVRQKAVPGALPPSKVYVDPFVQSVLKQLREAL